MARSKYRLVNGILEIDESLNRIQIDDFFGQSAACWASDAVFYACSIVRQNLFIPKTEITDFYFAPKNREIL